MHLLNTQQEIITYICAGYFRRTGESYKVSAYARIYVFI